MTFPSTSAEWQSLSVAIEGDIMSTKISREVIESFLNCRYKGHLKFAGKNGDPPEYQVLLARAQDQARSRIIEAIVARHSAEKVKRDVDLTQTTLKQGAVFILNAIMEGDDIALAFDGLKRVPGSSKLGNFHYIPVLFCRGARVRKQERILLDVYGLLLSRVQGRTPANGIIWHGDEARETRVRLSSKPRNSERLLEELRQLQATETPPQMVLNKHCSECEYRRQCRVAAVENDDLSLLTGLSPKEIAEQNRKGIFTVTQYSYTFRPGRMKRIVEAGGRRHDPALQALAIREGTVYVTQREALLDTKVKVYLDIEGLTDPERYYLIGLLIIEGNTSKRFSFWADRPTDEPTIWASFLEVITGIAEDFVLYHYGSYDAHFLRRMGKLHGGDPELLHRIEDRSVNVLALIQGRVFFPVYGNSLKNVAGFLGFRWSASDPSGLQAMAWRYGWETTGEEAFKQQLLAYNQEDCAALQRVAEAIRSFGGDSPPGSDGISPRVANVEDIKVPRGHKFCDPTYVLPEFAHITKCSYFDYQRSRVLFRTSPTVRLANRRKEKQRCPTCKVNEVVEYDGPDRCPHCGSDDFGGRDRNSRLVVDLKPVGGGLKRWVTRHEARRYLCRQCGETWMPKDYLAARAHTRGRSFKFGPILCGWVAYSTIALRQTNEAMVEAFRDLFGIGIASGVVSKVRSQAADRYRKTYDFLLGTLRGGRLVHVDETWAKVKGASKRGYVWVFASPDTALYVYSPNREGDTLRETLTGFKGVLVSDFYAAYDTLDCPQQKCLVHLVRDINDDLTKRPFDEELKVLANRFATLMQAVVQTIDRYGLKQHHLHKHKQDVDRFYTRELAATYDSEVAQHYQRRFVKYREKLFTFLDYDGVPWNNNNAENTVKRFVSRRKILGGTGAFSEDGFRDYLLLLSLYQTLRYRGISFWQFLLSGETDIDSFTAGRR